VYEKMRWPGITIIRSTLAVLAWPPAQIREVIYMKLTFNSELFTIT
jgi:hypothetical protein